MSYRKELMVKPGSRVRLKDIDPSYHGRHESHEKALPEIDSTLEQITAQQELLYAEGPAGPD